MASSLVAHSKYAVIALLFWIAVAAFPFRVAMAGVGCGTVKEALSKAFNDGYSYLATATTSRGLVVMFFIKRTGHWQIIGIDDDLQACVVTRGDAWIFAMEQGI